MTLRNAFGALALDVTLTSVKTSVDGVETALAAAAGQNHGDLQAVLAELQTLGTDASLQQLKTLLASAATEATLNAVGNLVVSLERAISLLVRYQAALPRDGANLPRVNVTTSASLTINGLTWGSNGGYPNWYATGSPNAMDARQQQTEFSRANALAYRNRWSFG